MTLTGLASRSDKWKDYLINPPKCHYCGIQMVYLKITNGVLPHHHLTKDHIVPLCEGGDDEPENMIPCCHLCNQLKGSEHSLNFFFEVLLKKYIVPNRYNLRAMQKAFLLNADLIPKASTIGWLIKNDDRFYKELRTKNSGSVLEDQNQTVLVDIG